ncbi:MAG: glycosyltransferase family 1 protein [Anaerolineae bacterium]|nr:glycosyltransferase family 4 protein [Anaerolineae bacterium]MCX8067418.1 glycosyltransferase family 4 protein [Anaerolineae bacterium]MDW7991164.1 glycosyltransferase family 1 protein [Anaerolineae bacterium]
MRIALNAWFWDQPETGSGQYTRRLAENLTALDPSVEVVPIFPRARGDLGKVHFEQIVFPREARRLGADLAHVPYWGPPLAPTIPTVVTIHDLIPLLLRPYRGGPLVRLYTALVSAATPSAALVLTDSESSRRDILAHLRLPPARVRSIPLAADARFSPDPQPEDETIRARYSLPRRYVLYLGGFDVRKNVVAALTAYRWVGPVLGEECPLVLAGRLPERDTPFAPDPRRQARELGLRPEWVRFIGPVTEEEKPALYRGAVAFVFPSRYEGFGLPPLEALACGTPVVGSDAASLPEVVGDAGILLPPDDAEGMAGAILQLAQDAKFRDQLCRRALVRAAHFSWGETARRTLEAYRDALS